MGRYCDRPEFARVGKDTAVETQSGNAAERVGMVAAPPLERSGAGLVRADVNDKTRHGLHDDICLAMERHTSSLWC